MHTLWGHTAFGVFRPAGPSDARRSISKQSLGRLPPWRPGPTSAKKHAAVRFQKSEALFNRQCDRVAQPRSSEIQRRQMLTSTNFVAQGLSSRASKAKELVAPYSFISPDVRTCTYTIHSSCCTLAEKGWPAVCTLPCSTVPQPA